jgi:hypothetical protein
MPATPLERLATPFVRTIVAAVQREYPNAIGHRMTGPDDRPTPRQIHPAFYGCLDWHSAVHMHWSLLRLVRDCGDALPDDLIADARAVLDRHLSTESLAAEAAYLADRPTFERPYGWGWALTLAAELADHEDTSVAASAIRPLVDTIAAAFRGFLPKAEFPTRFGMHPNSAFALARAWPWADRHDRELRGLIVDTARRWFADDRDYPAAWEPNGADFLSGALTEAELMSLVLPADEFARWFAGFLPEVPASLLEPVGVTDASDGQLAHLHGFNLSRAHGLRVVAQALGGRADLTDAADRLVDASIDHVVGDDWMVEHWLASFAILALQSE